MKRIPFKCKVGHVIIKEFNKGSSSVEVCEAKILITYNFTDDRLNHKYKLADAKCIEMAVRI